MRGEDAADDRKAYDAVDIARRMVQISIDEKIPLTNLKLQKLLYYAWIDYYKENGTYLYENEIQAWAFGPVVPDAYYEFWTNVSNIIRYTRAPSREIDPITDVFLEHVLDKYRGVSTSSLVEMTHEKDTPWSICYQTGKKVAIPFQTIVKSLNSENLPMRSCRPVA